MLRYKPCILNLAKCRRQPVANQSSRKPAPLFVHYCLAGLAVAWLIFPALVHAAYYWEDDFQHVQWPYPSDACIQGEAGARLAYLQQSQPTYQWRYTPNPPTISPVGVDSRCLFVIEQKISFLWVTYEVHDHLHIRQGAPDACPQGLSLDSISGTCQVQKDSGPPKCPAGAGNPLNTVSGNKYQVETDLPPVGISPLDFRRHYNSTGAYTGDLGVGWSHGLGAKLVPNSATTPDALIAVRPGGRTYRFVKNGANWDTDADVHDVLVETAGGWTFTTTDDTVETYDSAGRLVLITDVLGRTRTLGYAANRLDTVTTNSGESLTFTYDGNGRISTLTDQAGRVWTYSYDASNNLGYVIYPDATPGDPNDNPRRQYHYEDANPNLLTGITDENGNRYANWEYDAQGRATASYHGPLTGVLTDRINGVAIVYNPDGTRVLTNSRSFNSTYTTATRLGSGLVTGISGPGCVSCGSGDSSYSYDAANNNLLSRTANGATTAWGGHDASGNPGYMIEAQGSAQERRTDYEYDPQFFGRVSEERTPSVRAASTAAACTRGTDCRVVNTVYDASANPTSVTVSGFAPDGTGGWLPVSRQSTYQYAGPLNQRSQVDGPRTNVSDITLYAYYPDAAGEGYNRARLRTVTGPTGIVERDNIQYTATGRVAAEDRPNGLSLSYSYYPGNDRLETLSETDGSTSRITRWTRLETGEVESITTAFNTPEATTLYFGYDTARRLTRITDGLGNYIEFSLDTEGNRTGEDIHDSATALHRTLTRVFDSYNRLDFSASGDDPGNPGTPLETLDPVHDDFDALPDHRVDGEGTVTDFGYDALKRLTATNQDPGGLNEQTLYGYDAGDRLSTVTAPNGGVTTYSYDDLGNLVRTDSPDTGTTTYTHDAAGNILTKTTAAGTAEAVTLGYSYDALNRLLGVDAPGTLDDITFTYDTCANGVGRLCEVETGSATVYYAYDAFGNVISHQSIGYTHDAAGRVSTLTYPSGAVLTRHYDAAGQVSAVDLTVGGMTQPLATGIGYAPFGEVTSLNFGNGKSLAQDFDSAYRTRSQLVTGVLDLGYTGYDGNGNLETRTDSFSATGSFTYDALDRLDTADGPFGAGWNYDYYPNGNRSLGDEGAPVGLAYEAGSNRLDQVGSADVILDVAGNTLVQGNRSYSYTPHRRLAAASDNGVEVASFAYNGLGQRQAKDRPDGTGRRFLYGPDGELRVETDRNGNLLREYLYLNGRLLAVYYPDSDQDGQSNVAEDSAGTNPAVPDDDGDGLVNLDELFLWGTAIGNPDSDGDGVDDATEVAQGTDPNDPASGKLPGDVNGDGQVDLVDYLRLVRYVLGLDTPGTPEITAGDLNGSGALDTGDIVILSRMILNLVWQGLLDSDAGKALLALWDGMLPGAEAAVASGELYYVHTDHLGTPQAMTDEAGQVVWRAVYNPFGYASIDPASTVEMNVRYPGQYFDQETGLHYNGARYYDPGTGRYITSDPIGLDGGPNTYLYANANPVRFFDPDGEAAQAAAGLCLVPGVGWVSCAVVAGGATVVTIACIITGACEQAAKAIAGCFSVSDEDEVDDNCEALYQSTLRTCASLTGRKRFKCFEAARINRDQCYQERNR